MSLAKITLIGMYNYDSSLFDNIEIPDGSADLLNKDMVVNSILAECGEFETLYASPDFMKSMIGYWWSKWLFTINKWVAALQIEYDPLENYNRYEDTVVVADQDTTREDSVTGDLTSTISGGHTDETDATATAKRNSYDAANLATTGQDLQDGTVTRTYDDETTTLDDDRIMSQAGTLDRTDTTTSRIHGNIGVTTSQQMLQSELDLYEYFNLYQKIADLFKTELCVFVYE